HTTGRTCDSLISCRGVLVSSALPGSSTDTFLLPRPDASQARRHVGLSVDRSCGSPLLPFSFSIAVALHPPANQVPKLELAHFLLRYTEHLDQGCVFEAIAGIALATQICDLFTWESCALA